MTLAIVSLPLEYFPDPNRGRPIYNGQIFVGEPDLDPEILANRKNIVARQEDGTEIPISPAQQPVRTGKGGVPEYNGATVQILVEGNYSIKVLDRSGVQEYYWPNVFDGQPIVAGDDHDLLGGRDGLSAHNQIYRRVTTVAEIQSGVFTDIPSYFALSDRAGAPFDLVAGGAPDGFSVLDAGNGNTAVLNHSGDKVDLRYLGVIGDYDTDDTLAYVASLAYCQEGVFGADHKSLKIRVTQPITYPRDVALIGDNAPKMAPFPLVGDSKDYMRPGFKQLMSGAAVFFDGVATNSFITKRSDKYGDMSYAFIYEHGSPLSVSGLAFILDVYVYDAGGSFTTRATDGSSTADAIFINTGTLSNFDDVTIFGYADVAGLVVHNDDTTASFDADYNEFNSSLITSGFAIIGADEASGASSQGLTGNRFVGGGIYGADYHIRNEGDYTIPAIFIDGYMGDLEQNGIRAHSFTATNVRTYANNSIWTRHCNDIAFANGVLEFSTLAGVPNADEEGGFYTDVQGATQRFRAFGLGATGAAKLGDYLTLIKGPFQCIGAGQFDQALFGGDGAFVRIGSLGTPSRPFIQLFDNFDTQVNGWAIKWANSDVMGEGDTLDITYDNSILFSLDDEGGFKRGTLGMARGNVDIQANDSVVMGSFAYVGLRTALSSKVTDITDGSYIGQEIKLCKATTLDDFTIEVLTGNIRGTTTLVSGNFARAFLEWDGTFWILNLVTNN